MDPAWYVVANMTDAPRGGREPGKIYTGTRVFSPGTLLYVGERYSGMCEALHVIGLARNSHKFVNCVVPVKLLENIRPKLIYSPALLARLPKLEADPCRDKDWAESLARMLRSWQTMDSGGGPDQLGAGEAVGPGGEQFDGDDVADRGIGLEVDRLKPRRLADELARFLSRAFKQD